MGIPLPSENNDAGDGGSPGNDRFEGCVKRLEVEFFPPSSSDAPRRGLRDLTRKQVEDLLNIARCTIVAELSNECFDSYVLSKSSLFVHPHRIVMKTCGTMRLLNALPLLLCYASDLLSLQVKRCKYTRGTYMFPEEQPFPHSDFSYEADVLHKYFGNLECQAYVMNDESKRHNWHVFSAAARSGAASEEENEEEEEASPPVHTVEICMTELDRKCTSKFYKDNCPTAAEMSVSSGITNILPRSSICDFAFDPCGYSMCGVEGTTLSTIHVTPEDGFSYASFESMGYDPQNVDLEPLVERVLKCFKPGMFTVSVHLWGSAAGSWGSFLHPAGYTCASTQRETLPSGCAILYQTFRQMPASSQTEFVPALLNNRLSDDIYELPQSRLSSLTRDCSAKLINSWIKVDTESIRGELDLYLRRKIVDSGTEGPFYVMDMAVLLKLWIQWKMAFPRVHPFYAVKCNPNQALLSVLAALGAGFDIASKAELETVFNTGVLGDRVIFANPCKLPSHIREAANRGVNLTTFDSVSELQKLKKTNPHAEAVLRIQTSDPNARCPLGVKYGAEEEEWKPLLKAARDLGLQVVGVAFHVGSGASDALAFAEGIMQARAVYDMALGLGMHPFWLLDIGGGFVSDGGHGVSFSEAAQAINVALDMHFPPNLGVTIIAEPGRFFAEEPFTLVTQIFGTRMRKKHGADMVEYWINDGVYGSMNCLLFDHAIISARPLRVASSTEVEEKPGLFISSTVFGPTCDGLDTVLKNVELPLLESGDWLVFPRMGAYTKAAGSGFNGFNTDKISTAYISSGGVLDYQQQLFS